MRSFQYTAFNTRTAAVHICRAEGERSASLLGELHVSAQNTGTMERVILRTVHQHTLW